MTDVKANSAQLRHDIDTGKTGDKSAAVDPAAAPLGTDDEAAAAPPSGEAVALDRRLERDRGAPGRGANASTPEIAPSGMGLSGPYVIPALTGAAAGALVAAALALA